MNELLYSIIYQHVSAVLHVSVVTLKIAVTVPLCQSTISFSVCQEETDSQLVSKSVTQTFRQSIRKELLCLHCKYM